MICLVDTSAILALLVHNDKNHTKAYRAFEKLKNDDATLVVSNYILVESFALIQSRIGLSAVRAFQEEFLPLVTIHWVDNDIHHASITGLLTANRRALSLVDCVSFEIMRTIQIKAVFTFDKHFKEQGFDCIY